MELLLPAAQCDWTIEKKKKQTSNGLTFSLQALLNRHESYVGESQAEHERLTLYINQLETEKTTLQTTNEKIVEENRRLLTQLEAANTSFKDSDSHVKSLEGLLRDCEVEVRRLNALTRRTEELELKILEMEKERMTLSQQVEDSKDETRSTIKRWKESEIRVRQLEQEVQKIEWEAKKDKERYEEINARLERERVLERELGGAEGRLKGAAALQSLNGKAKGTTVVSHFVRDILRDNATLQAGIVELRELLQTSNDEVQNLREQILQHQPIEYDNSQGDNSTPTSLNDQVGWSQSPPKQVQQEVHVHHHYHAKIAGKRERTPTIRRSSRKRTVMALATLPSTPESSAPTTPKAGPHRFVSSPVLPISLQHPQARRNRWSVQSAATGSSIMSSFPSSPRSYYERSSSIFDRLEAGEESSRPTSPESAAEFVDSPFRASPRKATLDEALTDPPEETKHDHLDDSEARGSSESISESVPQPEVEANEPWSQELTPKPSQSLLTDERSSCQHPPEPFDSDPFEKLKTEPPDIIVEEEFSTYSPSNPPETPVNDMSTSPVSYGFTPGVTIQPSLRRTSSQDSLVSISGMDIHIAKRPTTSTSQSSSLLRGNKAYFSLSPSATRTFPTAQPLASVTEFTALSSMRSLSTDTVTSGPQSPARSVSVSVEALSGLAGVPPAPSQQHQQPSPGGFGRLVGGWVRGKWGIAPVKSSGDLRSAAVSMSTSSSAEPQSQSMATLTPPMPPFPFAAGRPPGINQKGPIPGFKPPPRPTGVQVKMVDEDGLKQSLAE